MNLSAERQNMDKGREQPFTPTGAEEQAIISEIQKGNFKGAETRAKSAELPESAWKDIDSAADHKLRLISDKQFPTDKPLTLEQANEAVKSGSYREEIKYGNEHVPLINTTSDTQKALMENDEIIRELFKLIQEAKDEAFKSMVAKPVSVLALPLIGNIYGIVKGRNLKKQLKRLEDLYGKLKDPAFLSDKLKADKISPNAGHVTSLVGGTLYTAGAVTATVAAAPVAVGVGIGAAIAGGVGVLIGSIKQIFDFMNVHGTKENLVELEKKVLQMKEQNDEELAKVGAVNSAYSSLADKNLEKLMGNKSQMN